MDAFRRLVLFFSIVLSLCASLAWPPDAAAEEPDAEKMAAVKELLEVTGAVANSNQFSRAFTDQMIGMLKATNPGISRQALIIVSEEVQATVEEELAKQTLQRRIYPIYAAHFTLEELEALIAFNKSPVGQKANQLMPVLVEESLAAAQSWSKQVGPRISARILERLESEGIDINLRKSESE